MILIQIIRVYFEIIVITTLKLFVDNTNRKSASMDTASTIEQVHRKVFK